MTTLTELIDSLVHEKTFSLEGLKAIEQMRQKADAQEARIKAQEATISDLRNENETVRVERDKLNASFSVAKKSEQALAEREAKVFEHEKARAVAEASCASYKDAMSIVFKPNTVREMALRNVETHYWSPGCSGPNKSTMPVTDVTTREEGT